MLCLIKTVSSYCKRSTIIPVPKKAPIAGLHAYRPLTLTSVVITTFERLLLSQMKGIKPDGHPPAPGLPRDLCRDHVCGPSLSIQYHHPRGSSLQTNQFTIPASTCLWITNVLADRRQQVELGKIVGDPKGYILSPLLFSLYTSDCRSRDPTVKLSGHRPHQRGPAYRCGVEELVLWYG